MERGFDRRGLLLGALALAGCTPKSDLQTTYQVAGPMQPPDIVMVRDFAVRPQDSTLYPAGRAAMEQAFGGTTLNPQEQQVAERVSSALAQVVAEGLYDIGRTVQRTPVTTAPGLGRYLLVDGQMLGLGQDGTPRPFNGATTGLLVTAQLFYLQASQPPLLLQAFRGEVQRAAGGRVATAAGGSWLGEGAISGGRGDLAAEGRALGAQISAQIKRYLLAQNWIQAR